jgi:solute carrier family 25 carnitine/acylcarnitine transporter 20/29
MTNNSDIDYSVIFGGSFAGIAQIITGHPFDTVKVRYVRNKYKYSNVNECVKEIRSEGYRNFFRGVTSPLIGSVIMNISTFFLYDFYNKNFYEDPFISGALTGASLSLVESPADIIKSRMQINTKAKYINTIKTIRKNNGIYSGLGITCVRNIFSVGGYFLGYEYVKNRFTNKYIGAFLGGASAGFLCWAPTYPLDFIKTTIQTDNKNKYNGISGVICNVYRKYGFKGFWNGFTPCIIRGVLVNPFVFLAYEIGINNWQ